MSMSSSNPSNYRVKINQHSGEGELGIGIDLEQVDVDPTISSNPSNIIDAATNVHTMEVEAETDEECDGDDASIYNYYNSFDCFAVLSHKAVFLLAVVALLGMGVTVGFGVSGVVEHSHIEQQQQNAVPPIAIAKSSAKAAKSAPTYSRSGGKAGKPAPICLSDHDPIDEEKEFCEENIVECGATFTNEKVVLSENLFCKERYWFSPEEEKLALNAAITLVGPDASIDCKGHSIRQLTSVVFASQCLDLDWRNEGNPFEPSNERKRMKNYCDINYQAGILLVDGAKAINCNVEDFYDGFYIVNGGHVQKSEAVGNRNGITIQDVTGSVETNVSDVYAHDNYKGIYVLNHASSNAVTIEDVTSKYNPEYGMMLRGPDIIVKDSTSSYNGKAGIYYHTAYEYDLDFTTNIQFEGKVSSHNNIYNGIEFDLGMNDSSSDANTGVIVKGEVSTYLNGEEGLHITSHPFQNVLFTVEDKGSWSSCQNSQADVVNSGDGTVTFFDESGDGYTCDTREGLGLPSCVTCPLCNTRALMNFENGPEQGDIIEDEGEDAALASTITTATTKRGGKAGKAASCVSEHDPVNDEEEFCAEDEIISCGATFTNEEVVLSDDLFCTDRHYDASEDELMALNAAITLSGPEASIDCKGHTIRQVTAGYFGSQCLPFFSHESDGDPFEPSFLRSEMKTWCDLYYQAGILLVDGATAVNCNVENFYDGFLVINGGEVMSSEASENQNGVTVHDLTGSIETTVSDVCTHNNVVGIYVLARALSNAVMIKDVTSRHNSAAGTALSGPNIIVKDSTFSYNSNFGINIINVHTFSKVQFEGKVSSHHHFHGQGIIVVSRQEVIVKGDVVTYLNRHGLLTSSSPSTTVIFTVDSEGSFVTCQNSDDDINSIGWGGVHIFNDEGVNGYTCDTQHLGDHVQGTMPTCLACPVCT